MSRLRTIAVTLGAVSLPLLYLRSRVIHLEQTYPPLPLELNSTPELNASKDPGLRTPDGDVYAARVPASALRRLCGAGPDVPLEELWPKVFFQSRFIKLEATVFGRGSRGDLGEHGFRAGQDILAGNMHVLRAPAKGTPMLIEWKTPAGLTRFFERLAARGNSWKIMQGGRQEWGVGPTISLPGEPEDMVELRYGTAQDFIVVEGEKGEGKVVPQWMLEAHRAYARALLDQAVENIRQCS